MASASSASPTISLTEFVDFVITAGPPKITKVKTIKHKPPYQPQLDFWKKLRDAIEEFHSQGKTNKADLDKLVGQLTDKKKQNRYPSAIKGYKKFLGNKKATWFSPPGSTWSHGGLNVRVNPELGLDLNGQRYVVKLYFKDDQPTKNRLAVVHEAMNVVLSPLLATGAQMAVIDVSRGKLILPSASAPSGISALLQAEAMAFMTLWNQV